MPATSHQQQRHLTAKLTANPDDGRLSPGTTMDAGSTVELHGRTAADDHASAGQS
jgi:hypothetical protein